MARTILGSIGALFLSLIVASSACRSPTAPTRPTGPFPVHGAVTVYSTGRPLAGVPVTYQPLDGGAETQALTDAVGHYALVVPAAGSYTARVSGALAGTVVVSDPTTRGDLSIDDAACRARYGQVSDARTLRPVSSATVALPGGTTMTDATGWYRVDLGCEPSVNFSTSFLSVRHPSYQEFQQVVGRGVSGVLRLDAALIAR